MSNILIASMYKSGSNHIAQSLANLLGAQRSYLSQPREGWASDPQKLDIHAASAVFERFHGVIYLQHVLGTPHNVGVIRALKPHVIVTIRGVYSILHSLRKYGDAMEAENRLESIPLLSGWGALSNSEKWSWVTFNTLPWLYQFYVSWKRAAIPVHFVRYEDHFDDQVTSAYQMLKFLGLNLCDFEEDRVEKAFIHRNANYTIDRTQLDMPEYIKDIAEVQALGWGRTMAAKIREDLLG